MDESLWRHTHTKSMSMIQLDKTEFMNQDFLTNYHLDEEDIFKNNSIEEQQKSIKLS